MTVYRLGSAWNASPPPGPSEEDQALHAYLTGDTDDVDHIMLRRRFAAEVMRAERLSVALSGAAERLQSMSAHLSEPAEVPMRVSELYQAGKTMGELIGYMTAAQMLRDILNGDGQ